MTLGYWKHQNKLMDQWKVIEMSISNIERMVDALVRDEMNMVRSMGLEEMDSYVEELIREKIELSMTDAQIIEEYER